MEVENFSKLLNEVVSNGKINFYYYSDPTSSNIELHHLAIPFPGELSPVDLPFRWHAEKPSEDLVDAIWDDETHSWVENSDKSQPALIAKLQANNEAIQKKMEIYEQDKIADAEKNDKLVQALTGVQKGQAQTTEVLAQLVPMVQQLSKLVTSSDETEKAKKEEGAE
ncbi:hypothetical protein VA644_07155 [Lactobacillus gasseri]|uniref:hypothetical protein n=1 Tax=Lactobacillus TaxID=1578 RepID=UPI000F4A885C|nr:MULTISPECIES: hypothetical protein [Lactobacillus]UWF98811.1 MAG: hypothetical protein [Bacteriophage sp.]WRS88565.1 hypothetical protein VA644_07155 [Lactobacillus gasseri]GIL32935.1 hypothetical protein PGA11657_08640 [Lactobacillus paragasseri]